MNAMTKRVTFELEHMARAEERAIERHLEYLCGLRGHEVSYEEAVADWQANYSHKWRQARLARMLERQREEINRHKWIESEKASHDLGREAVMDWVQRYARRWRQWYDENEGPGSPEEIYH